MTIPLALFVGLYMYKIRKGRIAEASIIGVIGVIASVFLGSFIPVPGWLHILLFSKDGITNLMAVYGFIASILPVWLLLCPRDYLSSYMKIGTIAALVIGVFIVMPNLRMPMVTDFIHGGGPIIPGKIFPFVFVTIACGAISGFHALVSSGTTPKMLNKESEARMIGYGAMLMEGLVGIIALIAASSLFPGDYFAIDVPRKNLPQWEFRLSTCRSLLAKSERRSPAAEVQSACRRICRIFTALPGMKGLMWYWYHFAIMFEALFILTTIDAGTRIGRFLVQEFLGRFFKPFEKTNWLPGNLLASGLIVFAWAYFIHTGSISTIWPMFGVANQLLASVALCVATTAIINSGKQRYVWVTVIPLVFVSVTTLSAGYLNITDNFLPMSEVPATMFQGYLDAALTAVIMICAVIILVDSGRRCYRVLVKKEYYIAGQLIPAANGKMDPPEYGCC